MQSKTQELHENLKRYKRKFYINKLLKGIIFLVGILLSAFILVSALEYFGYFNSIVRAIIFFGFIVLALGNIYWWIAKPLIILYNNKKKISDEEAARQIGYYFPNIKDQLLNTIQLEKLSSSDNSLINASIKQKTSNLSNYPFENAINYRENKRYLKYAATPVFLFVGLLLLIPQFFSESTKRIINYNQEYVPQAPFDFNLQNQNLKAFKNEAFTIRLQLDGKVLPENVYLNLKGRKHKMSPVEDQSYQYTIENADDNFNFYFEAAGYKSGTHNLKIINRPQLSSFNVSLDYPDYLNKENKTLKNVGNLTIPEGTQVTWLFDTEEADSLRLSFKDRDKMQNAKITDNQLFKYQKQVFNSQNYYIRIENSNATNKNDIVYSISVIPDKYPKIKLEKAGDTSLYNHILLAGNISDDYGFTGFQLSYKTGDEQKYQNQSISFNRNQNNQSFLYRWNLDSMNLKPGTRLEYYLTVWDNDALHNYKAARTSKQYFNIPSEEKIDKEIEKQAENTQKDIDRSLQKARELNDEMKKLQDKLKTKDKMEWEDKKAVEKMIEKHKRLKKQIENFQKQNQSLSKKRDRFSKEDQRLKEKSKQLQKIMDEVLDEETKKLFEELQKMLEERADEQDIREKLDELQQKDKNMERDLDRAMELFKQLKYDQQLSKTINKLDTLAKQQKKLADKTQKENNRKEETDQSKEESSDAESEDSEKDQDKEKDQKGKKESESESEKAKQESLNQKFKNVEEDLKKLREINESLEFKKEMQSTDTEEQSIEQKQQESSEQLEKNNQRKANESQKDAAEEMKSLTKKLQQMQQQQQKQQIKVDIKNLRNILENLLKLSFEQEELMEKFKDINQSDPQYVELSQKQLKIEDDAEIIKDSLHALSKRIFQIESAVNRDLDKIEKYLNESTEAIKARQPNKAAGKQQFVMTSMNNLALLLNDILQQLQKQMANQMKGAKKMCQNPKPSPGGKPNSAPDISELQKQLKKKMEQLKKSGKKGSELSEELAKMARQQAKIRRKLQEQQENEGQEGKEKGGKGNKQKLGEMMEETEEDLVNKNITRETIKRQEEILTRLLEHEKGERKQKTDNKRKAESPEDNQQNEYPPSFEKYFKEKEKQVELLKTISPNLTPFYKKEVNEYFKTLEE